MKTLTKVAAIAVISYSSSTCAAVLLEVDLSVSNQLSIYATDGASIATVSGANETGIYLADYFTTAPPDQVPTLLGGNLAPSLNTTNNDPWVWSFWSSSPGINIWDMAGSVNSTLDFEVAVVAFTGSASWTVSDAAYEALLAGNEMGDLYFPADSLDDLSSATLIGQWARLGPEVIPAPAPLSLLGIGVLGLFARKYDP